MVHFLHRRSARADATPLILTHGWPGSIAEFVDVVEELADPKDADAPAFHVVAPSLPGFGHSDKPTATRWGTEKIATAWGELMGRGAGASSLPTEVAGVAISPRFSAAGSRRRFSASARRTLTSSPRRSPWTPRHREVLALLGAGM
ncbi:alpha/beta fold hydrolase [Actinomadura nitritigenes]|uniref:alpha/beta fold hydrolase n=1 Tax=Actinomadura nitritigenes TaxID=134602 RepID=UPI003D902AB0